MKFTIRDLLLVTVIVALAAGWWMDRGRLAHALGRLEFHLGALASMVEGKGYEVRFFETHVSLLEPDRLPISPAPVPNQPKE